MALTRGDLNATLKDLTMIVEDTLVQTRPNLVPLICHVAPSDGAYTKIPIPANVPFPKKFEAERSSQGKNVPVIVTYNQETHELTIDLDSDLVKDSKAYGMDSVVREAAMSMMIYPDYLLSTAVAAGTAAASLAYDGNVFYGATHKYANSGTNNISNLVTQTGTTVPALFDDLSSGITALRGFKDNQGRLLNQVAAIGPENFLIQCPLALEQNIRALLNAEIISQATKSGIQTVAAAGVTNTLRNSAQYFPDGYLTGNTWYLHFIGAPQKPYVFFEDYAAQVSVLGMGSEHEINTNTVRIAIKHRFVLGRHRFDRSLKIG